MAAKFRPEFFRNAFYRQIPMEHLTPLETAAVVLAKGNPGAASAIEQLSSVRGGVEALERLVLEHPNIPPGEIWDRFSKDAEEDPARFRDAVNDYLDLRQSLQ